MVILSCLSDFGNVGDMLMFRVGVVYLRLKMNDMYINYTCIHISKKYSYLRDFR